MDRDEFSGRVRFGPYSPKSKVLVFTTAVSNWSIIWLDEGKGICLSCYSTGKEKHKTCKEGVVFCMNKNTVISLLMVEIWAAAQVIRLLFPVNQGLKVNLQEAMLNNL